MKERINRLIGFAVAVFIMLVFYPDTYDNPLLEALRGVLVVVTSVVIIIYLIARGIVKNARGTFGGVRIL